MTLGNLIRELERHDPNKVVNMGFSNPHSYRGDYASVAFIPTPNITVGSMLKDAKEALGSTYNGWKGGEFTMDKNTGVYISEVGYCGDELGDLLLNYMLGVYESGN